MVPMMSFNFLIKILILSVWLGCMAWLIRYEAFPHLFEDTLQGYQALARDMPALRDSWMKVMANDQHVGYANSTIELEEDNGRESLSMRSQFQLRVLWQETQHTLRFNSQIRLGQNQQLLKAVFTFSMADYSGDMTITPTDTKDDFLLTGRIQSMPPFQRRIKIPPEALLSSPLLDAGLQAVRPGGFRRIRTIDPLSATGETRDMIVRGESYEVLRFSDDSPPIRVTRISMQMGEITLRAWVDDYGRVMRQETPFGLVLVASTAQQAMQIPSGNAVEPLSLLKTNLITSWPPMPITP